MLGKIKQKLNDLWLDYKYVRNVPCPNNTVRRAFQAGYTKSIAHKQSVHMNRCHMCKTFSDQEQVSINDRIPIKSC